MDKIMRANPTDNMSVFVRHIYIWVCDISLLCTWQFRNEWIDEHVGMLHKLGVCCNSAFLKNLNTLRDNSR